MATPTAAKPVDPSITLIKDATCTFCGCVCDDIDLTVKDNHIIEAKRACVLGKAWFYSHDAMTGPAASSRASRPRSKKASSAPLAS